MTAVAKIANLEGLDATVLSRLKDLEIETVDDLWRRLMVRVRNDTQYTRRVQATARYLELAPDRLLEILAEAASAQASGRQAFGRQRSVLANVRHHLFEITAAALLAGVLGVVAWRATEDRTSTLVVPRSDLPAFHLLGPDDVVEWQNVSKPTKDRVTSLTEVRDRFTLRPVAKDSPLFTGDLSPSPFAALASRRILSLPAILGGLAPVPGMTVSLLLTASGEDTGGRLGILDDGLRVEDAVLLSFDHRDGVGRLVVALTEQDIARIKPVLGRAKIFVLQPANSPTPPATQQVTEQPVSTPYP